MRPLGQYVFELQNMHFDSFQRFKWNVEKFGPTLQRFLDEAYEEGKRAGRREMAEEAGRMLTTHLQKVV